MTRGRSDVLPLPPCAREVRVSDPLMRSSRPEHRPQPDNLCSRKASARSGPCRHSSPWQHPRRSADIGRPSSSACRSACLSILASHLRAKRNCATASWNRLLCPCPDREGAFLACILWLSYRSGCARDVSPPGFGRSPCESSACHRAFDASTWREDDPKLLFSLRHVSRFELFRSRAAHEAGMEVRCQTRSSLPHADLSIFGLWVRRDLRYRRPRRPRGRSTVTISPLALSITTIPAARSTVLGE